MVRAIGQGHSAVTELALYSSVYQRILESDVRPSAGLSRENSSKCRVETAHLLFKSSVCNSKT